MKYRFYKNSNNDNTNVLETVLHNREIEDYKKYLNLDENVIIPYQRLENIEKAVEVFDKHYSKNNCIGIIPDSDVDGQCSSAELYLYIRRMNKDYPIKIIHHDKPKAHGLSDIEVPKDVKLLIVADAGTNDIKECCELREKGIDIIILDHHEQEKDNPYAVVVNNQSSPNYPNKQLCGGGIVYKWLKALDDYYWNEYADDYLDLVAFSNISDVMDLREFETKYLVETGLKNINNKLIKALIEAQDYSINGKINIHNVQWYLTPIVNAMIRMGSKEEKKLLFKAFIEQDEVFEYKKRATKDKPAEIIIENIYDRVARLCKNVKSKQDRLRDKSVKIITDTVRDTSKQDKIIITDVTDILDSSLTGVVAIKIAEQFNKPCLLLRKYKDSDTEKIVYGGSGRNVNHSPIENLKNLVNSTGLFNFAQGHASAFGCNLDVDKKDEALKVLNELLKDVEYDSTYNVDFIMDVEDVDTDLIMKMSKFEDIICQGIEEPITAVENISLTRDCFEIFGKNEDTISFIINDIKYIQFKCKPGNKLYDFLQDAWDEEDSITFNIVGKPSINEYNGIKTPQIVIEDVNVVSTNNDLDDIEW